MVGIHARMDGWINWRVDVLSVFQSVRYVTDTFCKISQDLIENPVRFTKFGQYRSHADATSYYYN